MPQFIKGLSLSRAFYHEAVAPILGARFPGLSHSAALIGSGSEVLGYDDEMSRDHHWGPRVMLFLTERDQRHLSASIAATLSSNLPYSFMGYSTLFSRPKTGEGDRGTQLMHDIGSGAVNHRVEIMTIDSFVRAYLGIGANHCMTAGLYLAP